MEPPGLPAAPHSANAHRPSECRLAPSLASCSTPASSRYEVGLDPAGEPYSVDLAAIVSKAMQRAPDARYENAAGFARDLRAFLTGQLVAAHTYSSGQLFLRWLRRNRGHVLLASAACAVLLVSTALSVRRIVTERDRAEQARDIARHERAQARRPCDRMTLSPARSPLATAPSRAIASTKTCPSTGEDWHPVADISAQDAGPGLASRILSAPAGIAMYGPANDLHRLLVERRDTSACAIRSSGSIRPSPAGWEPGR
jgi:hypothetical protein